MLKPLTAAQVRAATIKATDDYNSEGMYILRSVQSPLTGDPDAHLGNLRHWLELDLAEVKRVPDYQPLHMKERIRALRYGIRLRLKQIERARA